MRQFPRIALRPHGARAAPCCVELGGEILDLAGCGLVDPVSVSIGAGQPVETHARRLEIPAPLHERRIDRIKLRHRRLKAHVLGHGKRGVLALRKLHLLPLAGDVLLQRAVLQELLIDLAKLAHALLDKRGEVGTAIRRVLQDGDALLDVLGAVAAGKRHQLAKRGDLAAVHGLRARSIDVEVGVGHPVRHRRGQRLVGRLEADLDHARPAGAGDDESLGEDLDALLKPMALEEALDHGSLACGLRLALRLRARGRLAAPRCVGDRLEHARIVDEHDLLGDVRLVVVHLRRLGHLLVEDGVELGVDLHVARRRVLDRCGEVRRRRQRSAKQ